MTPPKTNQHIPRTPFYVDWLLLLYAASLGLGTCLFLSVQDERQIKRTPAYFGGWLAGLVLPRLWRHRYRVLGFTPFSAGLLAIWVLIFGVSDHWPVYAIAVAGFLAGVGPGAILRYRDRFRDFIKHFYALAILSAAVGITLVVVYQPSYLQHYWTAYITVTLSLAILSVLFLMRAIVELGFEVSFSFMYRIKLHGPGVNQVPQTGPIIIIANHAQWFDPLFLAKFIPRETTPMMTSKFYDLRGMSWLMRWVFHTIRVEEKAVRREVPEIAEAVQALSIGKCVVIFPEGFLRRSEEQQLRRFGRGIWQILQQHPTVQVIPCWIEGSWGSYFSYFNGPPTKNKKWDWNREISLAVGSPITVPAEVLQDHLQTRVYLMKQVLAAREILGLPPATLPEMKSQDSES